MGQAAQRDRAAFHALGATCALAWLLLAFDGNSRLGPGVCAGVPPWSAPLAISGDQGGSIPVLPGWVGGWALMCAAMMLPMIVAPLRYLRDRSFAQRRSWAMFLFVLAYLVVWMVAGLGLQWLVLAARWTAPAALLVPVLVLVAAIWQFSPGKQWALNRCHRRPELVAFGAAADRGALVFGLRHGAACVATCWALMLLVLSFESAQLFPMIAVTLFVVAERFERPAARSWSWRWPGRLLRIAIAQACMQWQPRPCIRAPVQRSG